MTENSDGKFKIKSILFFVMHQFVGLWGTGAVAYFLATSVYEAFDLFHWHPPLHYLHWILSETPYYPVQIGVGVYLGWAIGPSFSASIHALGLGAPANSSLLCSNYIHPGMDFSISHACCISFLSLLLVGGHNEISLS